MTLLVARHAPVDAAGICYGRHEVATRQRPDASAVEIFEALGERRTQITEVWSSPAKRCRLPAEHLAGLLAVPVHLSDDLQELDYGQWEGQPWDILQRDDSERLKHWMDAWQSEAPPDGESIGALERRVRNWLIANGRGRLVVAHAGVIRALYVILRGLSWEESMAREIEHLKIEIFEPSDRP
ncbi:MAG: histidine phosphatase family protein [Deltaproteobacteria bacterium]|nr:histidine phosphatase family protein [Deltaproteobacteria bacterium]MBW2393788.1 histidine phosphatase family protein [Deltaproteobacteria bacterium]